MKFSFRPGANIQNFFAKNRLILFLILAYSLSILPVLAMVNILETTGVDSVSNDYLRFTKLADRVLSHGYNWANYFKDSFDNNVHSYAFLFLIRLVLAELTHLSVKVEIYLGLALTGISLFLLFNLFTRFARIKSPFGFFLFPLLSIFLFSYSQVSTFSYGETALQMGFVHLGILVGIWMLLLQGQSSITTWIMMISGILASFSGGAGLLAWPVFFLAILFTNTRRLTRYLAWLIGMILSLLPYLAYSSYSPFNGSSFSFSIFTPYKFVTGLGLPLANNINSGIQEHPSAFLAGLLGLGILLFLSVILIYNRSKFRFQSAIPSLLVIFWGISGSLQISISRSLLAPWYTTTYILFWIGLLGFCFSLIHPDPDSANQIDRFLDWDEISRTAGYTGMVGIVLLFFITNHTYQDKSFYLVSRSPVSAACLRNYQIAPTYCEEYVFQWGVGNPTYLSQMGSVLQKNNWSVFGQHQELTLQGDTILGKVNALGLYGMPQPQWVSGAHDDPTSWTDYRHLNLLIPPGQSIQWKFDLPPDLDSAKFQMGLSLVEIAGCQDQSISIRFDWFQNSQSKIKKIEGLCSYVHELSVSENLTNYSGKQVVITIANENIPSSGIVIRLHYPKVVLDKNLSHQEVVDTPSVIQPLNTDLSPAFSSPKSSANYLQTMTNAQLELNDLIPQNGDGSMLKNGQFPWARYTLDPPLCQVAGRKFFFKLGLSGQVSKRLIRIRFQYRDNDAAIKESSIDFPILSDEKLHAYTLNLDLLDIPDSPCITSLVFQLLDESLNSTDLWLQIKDVGFLH